MTFEDFTLVRRASGHATEIRRGNKRIRKATAEEVAMQCEIDRLRLSEGEAADRANMAEYKHVALRVMVDYLRKVVQLHAKAAKVVKRLPITRGHADAIALADAVNDFEEAIARIKAETGVEVTSEGGLIPKE